MLRLDDVDRDVVAAAHLDGFGAMRRRQHFVFEAIVAGAGVELFDIEIMDIDKGVRHAPGHVGRVPEMREAGDAGNSEADDVELVAGKMRLCVHVRHFQHAMRVAGDDRPPGRGAFGRDRPIVAAAVELGAHLLLRGRQQR